MGCGPSTSNLVGNWRYEVDLKSVPPDAAIGYIPLKNSLDKMHIELRADGTAVLINDKQTFKGNWSTEGRHIYIRPESGDMVQGDFQDGRIALEPLAEQSEVPQIKVYLVKAPARTTGGK